jgi:hypothetical protein
MVVSGFMNVIQSSWNPGVTQTEKNSVSQAWQGKQIADQGGLGS